MFATVYVRTSVRTRVRTASHRVSHGLALCPPATHLPDPHARHHPPISTSNHWSQIPCQNTVGFNNISQWGPGNCGSGTEKTVAECYASQARNKLYSGGDYYGAWYSTLRQGCATPTAPTPNCTWRVVAVEHIIESQCQKKKFMDKVAAYNQQCFNECPDPK
jgi:hypothetical protein